MVLLDDLTGSYGRVFTSLECSGSFFVKQVTFNSLEMSLKLADKNSAHMQAHHIGQNQGGKSIYKKTAKKASRSC